RVLAAEDPVADILLELAGRIGRRIELGRVFTERRNDCAIHAREVLNQRIQIGNAPELEESRLRDQRPRPLDVRLTRKLDDDSLGAYSLHVLLARARRIQAVAQDVDIAVDVL